MSDVPLWMYMVFAGLLGAVIGSFLNVVIHRMPRAESIVKPGSHCPECGRPIKPWNNIPLISWLVLRGKCPDCGVGIPSRYFLVELTAVIVAVAPVWWFGPTIDAVGGMVLGWHLIALAVIDLETLTVPDHVVLPMLVCGLIYAGVRDGWGGLGAALAAGLVGAMFPLFVMVISKFIMRRDGVGSGDVTMTAGFSVYLVDPVAHQFILKFIYIAFALAIAAAAALVGTGLVALISRTTLREKEIPFVPWLAIGAWIAFMFGEEIKYLYISLAIERAFG